MAIRDRSPMGTLKHYTKRNEAVNILNWLPPQKLKPNLLSVPGLEGVFIDFGSVGADRRFGAPEQLNDVGNAFLDDFVQLLLNRPHQFDVGKHVLKQKEPSGVNL